MVNKADTSSTDFRRGLRYCSNLIQAMFNEFYSTLKTLNSYRLKEKSRQ